MDVPAAPVKAASAVGAGIYLGAVMIGLDATVVNLALPSISHNLHASTAGIEWVVNAYTLPMASLFLFAGALGDRVGAARLYRISATGFLVGTVACALSPNLAFLVTARALQGVFAAGITPMVLALAGKVITEVEERAKAVNLMTFTGGAGIAIGPFIGGLLTETVGWRYVFWLTVIPSAGAAVLVRPVIEERPPRLRGLLRFDLRGQVVGGMGLILFVAGLIEGGSRGWSDPVVLALTGAGVVSLGAFVAVEHAATDPMMPLSVFTNGEFRRACIGAFAFQFGVGLQFLLALYLQRTWGLGAFAAGALLVTNAVGVVVAGGVVNPRLLGRGPHLRSAVGAVVATGGALVLLGLSDRSTWPLVGVGDLIVGIGTGIYSTGLNQVGSGALGTERAGVASGVYSTFRQTGTAVGIAVLGALIASPHSLGGARLGIGLTAASTALIFALATRSMPSRGTGEGRTI